MARIYSELLSNSCPKKFIDRVKTRITDQAPLERNWRSTACMPYVFLLLLTKAKAATPVAINSANPTHLAPACGTQAHKQTLCPAHNNLDSGIAHPRPPVITQTSHACYGCHSLFRPATRPIACLAQGCVNLARGEVRTRQED